MALFLVAGCSNPKPDVPLDEVKLDLTLVRMDEALFAASEDLAKDSTLAPKALFDKYFVASKGFITDWMFGGNDSVATDSLIGDAMKAFAADSHGRILLDTIHKSLGSIDLKGMVEPVLKRYKYFFPDKNTPEVVAYIDGYPPTAQAGLDQVFVSPRFLGIGMHYFMGPDFRFYPSDLPKYIRRRCTPEHIPSLVAHKIADIIVPEPELSNNPVLIDYVMHAGIKMYVVDKLLGPATHDSLKLYYDATQLEWATFYEGRVYKDLVVDLYSADAELQRRYVDDSPFTSQLNRNSAPRLGQYIGWRIVVAYMDKHPDLKLDGLVNLRDFQAIFKESGYRPPKAE